MFFLTYYYAKSLSSKGTCTHLGSFGIMQGRCWIIKKFGVILDIKHVSMFSKHRDLSDFFLFFYSFLLNINLLSTPHAIDHNLSPFCNV